MNRIFFDPIAELLIARAIVLGASVRSIQYMRAQLDAVYIEREWAAQAPRIMAL